MDALPCSKVELFRVDAGTPTSRLEMWNDVVCDQLVAVDCMQVSNPANFTGLIERRKCADIDVCQVIAGGQRVMRSKRHLARAENSSFLVNVQRSGHGVVRQDGHEARLDPGDLAIYSSDRKYELCFDDHFWQSVLIIPASHLIGMLPNGDQLVARRVTRSTCTEAIVNSIDTARDRNADSSQRALQHISDAVLHLIASELTVFQDSDYLGRVHTHLLGEIKSFVESQLDNPDLCPRYIADHFAISVPTVHRLFASEKTTFMASVWGRRLELCRRDLEIVNKHVSISEIAFRWGFNDFPHFSRSFKNRYGITPSKFRASACNHEADSL